MWAAVSYIGSEKESYAMKKAALICSVALCLAMKPVTAEAHGGYYYGGGCSGGGWPAFALGMGLGALFTVPLWAHSDPAPTYYISTPAPVTYTYAAPAPAPAPQAPRVATPPPAPPPAEPAPTAQWTPSSPGAGRWVPDPTPYAYVPAPAPGAAPVVASHSQSAVLQKTPQGTTVFVNR